MSWVGAGAGGLGASLLVMPRSLLQAVLVLLNCTTSEGKSDFRHGRKCDWPLVCKYVPCVLMVLSRIRLDPTCR